MPYIKEELRDRAREAPENVGELTYQLTYYCIRYLQRNDLSFQTISEIRAALQGTQSEFDRRIAFPYETRKERENGSVFPYRIIREAMYGKDEEAGQSDDSKDY